MLTPPTTCASVGNTGLNSTATMAQSQHGFLGRMIMPSLCQLFFDTGSKIGH